MSSIGGSLILDFNPSHYHQGRLCMILSHLVIIFHVMSHVLLMYPPRFEPRSVATGIPSTASNYIFPHSPFPNIPT